MKSPIIQSRFRGVYFGLLVLWVASCLGLNILINSWVLRNIKTQRAQGVESLVHSHADSLQLNDTRAIRDELLRQKVLRDDRGFEQLRPSRKDDELKIQAVLRHCQFVSTQTCAGPTEAVIFNEAVGIKTDRASFAILLNTSYFDEIQGSAIWKVLGFFGLAVILGFVAWAIRQQEKFLLEKIGLLSAGLQKVESFFGPVAPSTKKAPQRADEFEMISDSIEQAATLLESKTRQIEEYKKQFENKTRMAQLAQTISYTSHNLKAPLQEGAEFLRDLPSFIETMPRENLLRSARSLEVRLKKGAESLQQALNATKDSEIRPMKLSVTEMLNSFKNRIEVNPNLQQVKIEVTPTSGRDSVYCNPAEMDSVFWNLARNSIEAKPDSHILVVATVEKNEIIVNFRDNGPGIPDSLLDSIFSDFYTTKARGTGLGLASARKTIEKSRGKISALPAEQGAHFEIRLPLMEGAPNA